MDKALIETVIKEQYEEFSRKLEKELCDRAEENLVDLNSPLAQVVIGIRRSGKSTLCFNIIKKSGINFAYLNFDDERFFGMRSDDLNVILEILYKVYGDFNHLSLMKFRM